MRLALDLADKLVRFWFKHFNIPP